MKTSDQLEATAQLLEKGWTQGRYARDEKGEQTPFAFDDAVCFCITGAIYRVCGVVDSDNAYEAIEKVVGTEALANWNDDPSRTQSEVVAAVREAARLAREQEA